MSRISDGARGRAFLISAVVLCVLRPASVSAQIGALVSPGRLSRAHASLEGIANCLQCHSAGQRVAADKCLACHKPVAERIAQKRGVHRAVTTDCISCHVEHAGVDAELRPFDTRRFDHSAETRFRLNGLHAPLAASCASCHKTRSFLQASVSCASCHMDVHKGSLGARCETCHATSVRFAETSARFDHTRTGFPLTGAHDSVTCASCHRNGAYKGLAFSSCRDCHADPHRQALGPTCSSCHVTQTWHSTRLDHSRTGFPLVGRHGAVECIQCHRKPAAQVRPKADTCAGCHSDPHRGEFKQDCAACHTESDFEKGKFDHSTTRFALTDKHAPLACVACHKDVTAGARLPAARLVVDFRGLRTECQSCHFDVHRAELGAACETCHTARTFEVTSYSHARHRPFFEGEHAPLRCIECHTSTLAPLPSSISARPARIGFVGTVETCASCHRDVHFGQVGQQCERCHTVADARFAMSRFDHGRTAFALTGKHAALLCEACHKVATHDFPSGRGTTRQLTGIAMACASCHQNPHRGELQMECQSCHSAETFAINRYTHRNARALTAFFAGKHATATCAACHKPIPSITPAAALQLMSFRTTTSCTSCHADVHRGALGPRCESCHRP